MSKLRDNQLQIGAWLLSGIVVLLAVLVWGQSRQWTLSGLSAYQLFPLFGLMAFSLMWSHYMAAAARQYTGSDKAILHTYFEVTSLGVLLLILLHPGLLTWQLWRDGFGLPPGSELHYVGTALRGSVILGMISLGIFLAYELRRKFSDRSWWKFVQYASDVAMLLIFWHALHLGNQIRAGWFRYVWLYYGVTLIGALVYMYVHKYQQHQKDR